MIEMHHGGADTFFKQLKWMHGSAALPKQPACSEAGFSTTMDYRQSTDNAINVWLYVQWNPIPSTPLQSARPNGPLGVSTPGQGFEFP